MSKTTRVASYTKDTPEFLMPKMPKSNLHFVWGKDGALHIIPIDNWQPVGLKVIEQYHDETGKMTDPAELARMLKNHGALLAACKFLKGYADKAVLEEWASMPSSSRRTTPGVNMLSTLTPSSSPSRKGKTNETANDVWGMLGQGRLGRVRNL